ncbi:alpha/beta-hydrolase [Fomitiporia mediterranea MF3/22]|uniref:alpha/beta-hydrolase n=1 Tax=Fomitiporia mediterranea (strain MF3/22) TaxID=694068 RepID=UPI0004407BF7|nr:alpha/beta-hydrolase [Fomitiporia mediterranea MF3/22]EJC99309.1 alpha/beta-hydrolase [Fomitiporia mediterranea MF3/22]
MPTDINSSLPPLPLPQGIESKYVAVNGLLMHFLDASPNKTKTDGTRPPLIVLVHGFPELAYSWRKLMRPLADLGFRVVAIDQRGFGRTIPNLTNGTGNSSSGYPYTYDGPLAPFSFSNRARDTVAFVYALGYERVSCIMGHDSGSITASSCALIRPDLFRSLVMMSAPFLGVPDIPFNMPNRTSYMDAVAAGSQPKVLHPSLAMDAMFAKLDPPRMYYQHYYSLPQANKQMHTDLSTTELHNFFRTYFHIKSACWPDSSSSHSDVEKYKEPCELRGLVDLSRLPPYYLMPRGKSMLTTVGEYLPRGEALERSRAWMSDADVDVYAGEYGRTGFQGGLNRYRIASRLGHASDTLDSIFLSDEDHISELALFAQKKVEVPTLFVSAEKDWCPFQYPGALDQLRRVCPLMKERNEGIAFIKDTGHWIQQENNVEELFVLLQGFLQDLDVRA